MTEHISVDEQTQDILQTPKIKDSKNTKSKRTDIKKIANRLIDCQGAWVWSGSGGGIPLLLSLISPVTKRETE